MTDRKEFVLQIGEKIIQFQETEDAYVALTNLGHLIYSQVQGTELVWHSITPPKSKAENLQEASKTADSSKPEQITKENGCWNLYREEIVAIIEERTREIVKWENLQEAFNQKEPPASGLPESYTFNADRTGLVQIPFAKIWSSRYEGPFVEVKTNETECYLDEDDLLALVSLLQGAL